MSTPERRGARAAHHLVAERYKTRVCSNFATTGRCPYQSRCVFAHGEGELRSTDMNVRDGLLTEAKIRSFNRAKEFHRRRESQKSTAKSNDNSARVSDAEEPVATEQRVATAHPWRHNPYSANCTVELQESNSMPRKEHDATS
jgi:hypothetical protein